MRHQENFEEAPPPPGPSMDEIEKKLEEAQEGPDNPEDPDPQDDNGDSPDPNEQQIGGGEDGPDGGVPWTPAPESAGTGGMGAGFPMGGAPLAPPPLPPQPPPAAASPVFIPPQRPAAANANTTKPLTQEQRQQQPDHNWSDVLTYALAVPFKEKRVICVVPDRPKRLLILQLKGTSENGRALFIGNNENAFVAELKPNNMRDIVLYREGSYGDIVPSYQFVIFFHYTENHPFWSWLNQSGMTFEFIDYLKNPNSRTAILNMYPFFHVNTIDVKNALVPGYPLPTRFLPTLHADTLLYSVKEFKNEFYAIYDQYAKKVEYQMFYELFFEYYEPIVRNKMGIAPSARHLKKERFENSLRIATQLNTIEITSHIRNAFKEARVLRAELEDALKIRTKLRDLISIVNQKHRTLDGIYYVVAINEVHVLLQTRVLIHEARNFEYTNANFATASNIDAEAARLIKPYTTVFLKTPDVAATLLRVEKGVYIFQIDESDQSTKYKCITNADLLTREACLSRFDAFGNDKQPDIWDKPCEYDFECPFFGKGEASFRGGCGDGGYCEMPLGYENLTYRYYTTVKDGVDPISIRFAGDMFE